MTKEKFISSLKRKLLFQVSKKESDEIIKRYEQYFSENAHLPEEELVEKCGDIELVLAESLNGRAPSAHMFTRIIILFALSIIGGYLVSSYDLLSIVIDSVYDLPSKIFNPFYFNFSINYYSIAETLNLLAIFAYMVTLIALAGKSVTMDKVKINQKISLLYLVNVVVIAIIIMALYFIFDLFLFKQIVFIQNFAYIYLNICISISLIFSVFASFCLIKSLTYGKLGFYAFLINSSVPLIIRGIIYYLKHMDLVTTEADFYYNMRYNIIYHVIVWIIFAIILTIAVTIISKIKGKVEVSQ